MFTTKIQVKPSPHLNCSATLSGLFPLDLTSLKPILCTVKAIFGMDPAYLPNLFWQQPIAMAFTLVLLTGKFLLNVASALFFLLYRSSWQNLLVIIQVLFKYFLGNGQSQSPSCHLYPHYYFVFSSQNFSLVSLSKVLIYVYCLPAATNNIGSWKTWMSSSSRLYPKSLNIVPGMQLVLKYICYLTGFRTQLKCH